MHSTVKAGTNFLVSLGQQGNPASKSSEAGGKLQTSIDFMAKNKNVSRCLKQSYRGVCEAFPEKH